MNYIELWEQAGRVNDDEVRRSQPNDIYQELKSSVILQERRNIPDLHNLKTYKTENESQI